MPADPSGSSCALQLAGHDATVYFSSPTVQVQPACSNLIRINARDGELWNESPLFVSGGRIVAPSDPADNQRVCRLRGGSATAVVWDSGGAFYGEQVCEQLLAGTWTEAG